MRHFIATVATPTHRMRVNVIARTSTDAIVHILEHIPGVQRLCVRPA